MTSFGCFVPVDEMGRREKTVKREFRSGKECVVLSEYQRVLGVKEEEEVKREDVKHEGRGTRFFSTVVMLKDEG